MRTDSQAASKAAIVALAHASGTEWRTEELGFNPYANLPVSRIGVRFTDGVVVDYTVRVTDALGSFTVWARNLDRAVQLEWKTGDSREFNLRNFAINLDTLDEVGSADNSAYRVEILTPAQFHFATSLGGIDFQPQMLSATLDQATYAFNSVVCESGHKPLVRHDNSRIWQKHKSSQCGTCAPDGVTWRTLRTMPMHQRSRRAAAASNDNDTWRGATFRFAAVAGRVAA